MTDDVKTQQRVVLGVTGSIAAYKAADIIRRLREKGFKVSVVMTKEAEHFITPLTLSSLAGEKVYGEMFEGGGREEWAMPHIDLARQADVLLIAPATANVIAKLAHGMADSLLTCVALATRAKILVAPAMNTEMYRHKIVQENCARLKKAGVQFIDPVQGKLACGLVGEGHIADVETIVGAVTAAAKR